MPQGSWKRASQLLSVKGIQYRRNDVLQFARLAIAAERELRPFGLLIEPEPDNENDENALKVLGWCGSKSFHVGYVDRIEAARFSERYTTKINDVIVVLHAFQKKSKRGIETPRHEVNLIHARFKEAQAGNWN